MEQSSHVQIAALPSQSQPRILWVALLAAVSLLATILLIVPRPESVVPGVETILSILVSDKLAHFLLYFVLSISTLVLLPTRFLRTHTIVGMLAAHAVLTEVIQLFVAARHGELGDCLANIAGIAAGLSLFLAVRTLHESRVSFKPGEFSLSLFPRD